MLLRLLALFALSSLAIQKDVLIPHPVRNFNITVVCTGENPDCDRAMKVAKQGLSHLSKELKGLVKFNIVALREDKRKQLGYEPDLILANILAGDLTSRDNSDFLVVISNPNPVCDSIQGFLNDECNVLGVSYLGIIGRYKGALLVRDELGSVTFEVVAHEMAHALGAGHDGEGLMTPSVTSITHTPKLSNFNLQQITYYLMNLRFLGFPK